RDADLKALVAAERTPENESKFGRFTLSLVPERREWFRSDAHAFLDTLPNEPRHRSNIFTLLALERPEDVAELVKLVQHVAAKYPNPAERQEYLDYTDYWTAPPD